MPERSGSDETRVGFPDRLTGDIGAPDASDMRLIRNLFLADETLVETATFDSVLHPEELRIRFTDGIGDAEWCRLDCTWYTSGAYRFHYVDSEGTNWRFDRHPNTHSPDKHFHEPPNGTAQATQPSCITVEEPRLVARAVLKLWRRAYATGSFTEPNTANNPP